MIDLIKIKSEFIESRDKIFNDPALQKNSFKFCVQFSLLVEESILKIFTDKKIECALVSSGSFSRRELSPYSDIDIMFILESIDGKEQCINECVRSLWDCGIEVSHTVRELSDIERFLDEDLHAFTQFFETRFILGSDRLYQKWNTKLFESITEENKHDLLFEFFDDIDERQKKYGDSPKILEPNIKFSSGGLRDLQVVEWMYSLKNKLILTSQSEITQTENFLNLLMTNMLVDKREISRLLESYKLILNVRNLLHLMNGYKNDRFEFKYQENMADILDQYGRDVASFMKKYFESAGIISRFSKTMIKRFQEQMTEPVSEHLTIQLDDDFAIKNGLISLTSEKPLTLPEILRVFYYRGLHNVRFDEFLRSLIIEITNELEESEYYEPASSVFFREILKLPAHIGETLSTMNELGVLGVFLPEFKDLIGFFQPGVYHCYTADEHTLIALNNMEKLDGHSSKLGKLFGSIKERDLLYLAVLLHDIGKPISVSGHEILGAEIAGTIMERLGYEEDEIDLVRFLVRHHLTMEQVAFRRNLNDPATLNDFAALVPSSYALDLLYLLTYADLSAVNEVIWTQWKADLLNELYRKVKSMLDDRITGEEVLHISAEEIINIASAENIDSLKDHLESIDDVSYLQNYTQEEISRHIEEIEKGLDITVFFKENSGFTNVTVITRDTRSLLSKLCGALSINDVNIHDAKIFTRKDGIVIDSFNVTDFRSHEPIEESRYKKIEDDISLSIRNQLQIGKEFVKIKSKWKRLEDKFFKRKGKVKIVFERHSKYTIIDVFSPDRLGLLYQITKTMNLLGLSIYLAKIATKGDDVIDAFYTLDKNGKKVSPNDYELIKYEINQAIEELL